MHRRVVITGIGLVSPLGNNPDDLWQSLQQDRSGVVELESVCPDNLPSSVGGEARQFTGRIEDYGPLEKQLMRSIKKGRKLMCREIEMGVAAAQLALQHSGIDSDSRDPDRIGVVYGSDYIMTEPEEFLSAIKNCLDEEGKFHFERWGTDGISKVEPLWLLKYLPNMPASHIAIYNDLRGPSNSITSREASSNLSIAEAFTSIQRDAADIMVAGATGTRIHRMRTVYVSMQEKLAPLVDSPSHCCRPFELNRTGMVIGEGSGAVILETLESAEARNAEIYGEIIGHASSCVRAYGGAADFHTSTANALRGVMRSANLTPDDVGHVNAHGLATMRCDREEAQAIQEAFAQRKEPVPVVAPKSHMGNLGAGSGAVELIASLMAQKHNELFPILNYETPDPECPIAGVNSHDREPGDVFVNVNVTPQGQASALAIRRVA